MVSARGVAQKLREQQDLHLKQELQDLHQHQALMWAFQESAGQYSKLNCFCDQPTEQSCQKVTSSHSSHTTSSTTAGNVRTQEYTPSSSSQANKH